MSRSRAEQLPGVVTEYVPFSRLTTLEVGGPARYFVELEDRSQLPELLRQSRRQGLDLFVVGEGSNLLVSDAGFDGLVLRLTGQEISVLRHEDGLVHLRVDAGVVWDELVERAVSEGWAGIECLSGIPGRVGAAPIQNIGAYGQEVAEVITAVTVVERRTGQERRLTHAECGFGYRHSHFKGRWRDRFVVSAVEFALRSGGVGTVRYADLARRLAAAEVSSPPRLSELRQHVLEIRRAKSMVRTPRDPNRRSAGSFFMNPIVDLATAEMVRQRTEALPGVNGPMPAFPAGDRHLKLSAAWLIERAGFARGHVHGRVGLSSNHVLALVNRGGAQASELLALAGHIRKSVEDQFGVTLWPEPDLLGFGKPVEDLLRQAQWSAVAVEKTA